MEFLFPREGEVVQGASTIRGSIDVSVVYYLLPLFYYFNLHKVRARIPFKVY